LELITESVVGGTHLWWCHKRWPKHESAQQTKDEENKKHLPNTFGEPEGGNSSKSGITLKLHRKEREGTKKDARQNKYQGEKRRGEDLSARINRSYGVHSRRQERRGKGKLHIAKSMSEGWRDIKKTSGVLRKKTEGDGGGGRHGNRFHLISKKRRRNWKKWRAATGNMGKWGGDSEKGFLGVGERNLRKLVVKELKHAPSAFDKGRRAQLTGARLTLTGKLSKRSKGPGNGKG